MTEKAALKLALAIGMVGLAAVAAWLNIKGESAFWVWAGAVLLFLSLC